MDQKSARIPFGVLPASYLVFAFIYIIAIIKPVFYFHHVQPPFLRSLDFLLPFFKYPGGLSELVANLFMQSFYNAYLGPAVFFGTVCCLMWLTVRLLNVACKSLYHIFWGLIPLSLAVVLTNNYNYPFAITISMIVVLLWTLVMATRGKRFAGKMVLYSTGVLSIYYFSGSGYMLLFTLLSLFFSFEPKAWKSLVTAGYMAGFAAVIPPLASGFVFPMLMESTYLQFFRPRLYFMAYEPSPVFYLFLFAVPILLSLSFFTKRLRADNISMGRRTPPELAAPMALLVIGFIAFFSHRATYRSDAKNIVATDYYCHVNRTEKTASAATSLEEYSFAANLNFNLAMGKAGVLNERFFDFFQIAGPDALYPDVAFSSEMLLIASEFYYDLGYISEARHYAYEALVNYPYSLRVLQNLVKIHLVTGEYKAAERCLKILGRGLTGRKTVREFAPYMRDTVLLQTHDEFMEKRSFIPAEKELSPFADQRFQELLEANRENKRAYEYLMLYCLLDAQLDRFMELHKDAGFYFREPVAIYEEAILLYGEANHIPVEKQHQITPETLKRFHEFNRIAEQFEGNSMQARNSLYKDYGNSYMYYLKYIYPRIVRPEIVIERDEEPPI